MNVRTLSTVAFAATAFAATLLAAAPAQAQEITPEPAYVLSAGSTLSRAEVRAELLRHLATRTRSNGDLDTAEAPTVAGMGKTRAQVRAELAEAQRLGLVGNGERSVFPTPEQQQAIVQAGERALATQMAAR